MSRHMFIPDTQVIPGCKINHIAAAAEAVVEYMPDVLVIAGDWWDFPSLNGHALPGSIELEGSRFAEDVNAGNEAFKVFCAPMEKEIARRNKGKRRVWNPRKVFLTGNHCHRADRVVLNDPKWEGIVGSHLCDVRDFERHKFLEVIEIDGIAYSHYFANTHSGRPIGGSVDNRLNKIGRSFVQGHEQGFLYGVRQFPGNITRHGIVAGSFYQHEMGYRGPQGQDEWKGIVVMNEVHNGTFDIMPLSMKYLLEKYA